MLEISEPFPSCGRNLISPRFIFVFFVCEPLISSSLHDKNFFCFFFFLGREGGSVLILFAVIILSVYHMI